MDPPGRSAKSRASNHEPRSDRAISPLAKGTQTSRRGHQEADPRVGRRVLELRGAGGLGAGVEVVDGATGGVGEGILLRRFLVRRLVLGGAQQSPPGGCKRSVLHLRALRTRQEVAAVGLAVVWP
jgi:hypothetical protein